MGSGSQPLCEAASFEAQRQRVPLQPLVAPSTTPVDDNPPSCAARGQEKGSRIPLIVLVGWLEECGNLSAANQRAEMQRHGREDKGKGACRGRTYGGSTVNPGRRVPASGQRRIPTCLAAGPCAWFREDDGGWEDQPEDGVLEWSGLSKRLLRECRLHVLSK